jgi:hypothetical protein
MQKHWIDEWEWLAPMTRKWDEQTCYNLAKKCQYKHEFRSKYLNAYRTAVKRGWVKQYTWLQEKFKKHWKRSECRDLAMQYTTLKEFRINHYAAYYASFKKGWLYDFDWLESAHKDRRTDHKKQKKEQQVKAYYSCQI